MQKRPLILSAILLVIIAGSFGGALYLQQRRVGATVATAGVPAIPDLSRWPEALRQRLQPATTEARTGKNPVGPLTELAKLYFANGFAAEASETLGRLRELEPARALWPYLLADLRRRAGDASGEEDLLRATLALDASYSSAWLRLADALAKRNAPGPDVREAYQKALALHPDNVRAQFALLSFDARLGTRGDLRRELTALARAHPQIKQLHELLGELHRAAGDVAEETRERQRLNIADRELENGDPWIDALAPYCFDSARLSLMAVAAFREHRLPEAETLLKQAIPLAPADATLRDSLAHVYELLSRPADALAVLEQATREIPDDPLLWARFARLLSLQHRTDEALASLQAALVRWPRDAGLHAARGFTLRDAGRSAEALPEFREAVRLEPTFVEAHYQLGFCLLSAGDRDAARAAVEKALAMRPDYPDALRFLASLALEARDVAAAGQHVERLYSLQPEEAGTRLLFATWHLLKGSAANDTGNFAGAETIFRRGLEALPDFPPLLRESGLLAIKLQKFAEAATAFERYVSAEPNDAEGYVLLGKTLLATQRDPEARQVFESGLRIAEKTGAQNHAAEIRRMLSLR
ncbi:MAG: tetratricopeptide repeat protein [Opitutaceae bacterium]